ncbi:MAG: type II secretion system protein GspG [Persicimonas sp.]
MKTYLPILLIALLTTACASGPSETDDQPAEQPTQTTTEKRAAEIPEDELAELEEKLCRATLDYLERNDPEPPPERCERVVLRPTDRFGSADTESYLVTVIVGADRRQIELGAEVDDAGEVEVYSLESALAQAATEQAKREIRDLESMVDAYYLQSSPRSLPDSLDELTRGDDPIAESIPNDPWGNAYIYRVQSESDYELFSAGPDGEPDTSDDVR